MTRGATARHTARPRAGAPPRSQLGLSLIELMVGITIGLLLMAGVIQLFLGTKQTYTMLETQSRLQESGRFALSFLAGDLRMAGYYGCHGTEDGLTNVLVQNPGSLVDQFYLSRMDAGGGGFEATTASSWNPDPAAEGADPGDTDDGFDVDLNTGGGSDIIFVRRPILGPFALTADMSDATDDVQITTNSGLAPDDIILLTDCESGVLFQLTSTAAEADAGTLEHAAGGANPGNASGDLGRAYKVDSGEVYGMGTVIYYVADNADGVPSLFRRINTGNAQELVNGVENLQIVYGVDDDDNDNAELYVDADTIESNASYDWDEVVSARIAMLVRTLDPVKAQAEAKTHCLLGDPSNACAGGTQIDTNDTLLRQVFNATVVFRNRVGIQ